MNLLVPVTAMWGPEMLASNFQWPRNGVPPYFNHCLFYLPNTWELVAVCNCLITIQRTALDCLGVIIDSKLNFNEHVDYICKKANTTQAFVHRNTKKLSDEGQGPQV